MFNIPKFKSPQINHEIFLNLHDLHEVTKQILGFLGEQSKTAERQFKTSRNLIIATIFIMLLQIVIAGIDIIHSNSAQYNVTKVIEIQSQQSEVISRMSMNLLDLENQVLTLEQ